MTTQKDKIRQNTALTFARFDFSALEIDLLAALVFHVQQSKTNPARFLVSELSHIVGGNSNANQKRIKTAVNSLQTKVLEYNQDGKSWTRCQIIGKASYNAENTALTIFIDPDIFSLLSEFRKYTIYHFKSQLSLSSRYSKRLYQVFRNNLKSGSFRAPVDYLRGLLAVPDSYNWKTFFDRCIIGAVSDINKETELKVKATPEKKGRAFAFISFSIELKSIPVPMDENTRRLVTKLKSWNFADSVVIKLRRAYTTKEIWNWVYKSDTEGKNPAAYFNGIIQNLPEFQNQEQTEIF